MYVNISIDISFRDRVGNEKLYIPYERRFPSCIEHEGCGTKTQMSLSLRPEVGGVFIGTWLAGLCGT